MSDHKVNVIITCDVECWPLSGHALPRDLTKEADYHIYGNTSSGQRFGIQWQMDIMTKHGLRVVRVTMDGFQSADSLQQLRQQGYDAEVSSVDRSIVPYELVKAAIYEDRLMLYNYQPVVDELKRLEHNKKKGKVDHPSNGEKDLADALAGVVFSLSVSRQMALSGLPPNVLAPSLGISEDPEDDVHGVMVDGKFHAVENWDEDFKGDGGIMVAPLWMTSGRGNVPTLPVQKGSREIK